MGPDKLDPYFLKLAVDLIAEPLTHISNSETPTIWKLVFPLLKGSPVVNNYRQIISKLCFLAKLT